MLDVAMPTDGGPGPTGTSNGGEPLGWRERDLGGWGPSCHGILLASDTLGCSTVGLSPGARSGCSGCQCSGGLGESG